MNPARLLIAVAFLLALVVVAWFLRSGRWRQRRFALVTCGLVASLLLLSHRVSLADLAILTGLVMGPFIILAPPKHRD